MRVGGLRSERGVSLIHVAVAIFVLMGFSAFVLDHGVLMLANRQWQSGQGDPADTVKGVNG